MVYTKMYNLDGAGLFSKDYNEIYTVLNKMRNNNKFDYVCSATENDPNFLDLDCIEGKILKYILQINVKVKKEQQKQFIVNNELNVKELSTYVNNINTSFTSLLSTIDKNILDKSSTTGGSYYYKGTRYNSAGDAYDAKMEDELFSYIFGFPFILVYQIAKLLIVLLLTPFFLVFGSASDLWEDAYSGGGNMIGGMLNGMLGGSLNEAAFKKMSLKELKQIKAVMLFIKMIINKLITKISANNIKITNVCINGTSVKGQRKHIKCKKDDYKSQSKVDMSVIKKIFKSMDFKLDKISDLSNIDNLKKELKTVPDEKNVETEASDDSESN